MPERNSGGGTRRNVMFMFIKSAPSVKRASALTAAPSRTPRMPLNLKESVVGCGPSMRSNRYSVFAHPTVDTRMSKRGRRLIRTSIRGVSMLNSPPVSCNSTCSGRSALWRQCHDHGCSLSKTATRGFNRAAVQFGQPADDGKAKSKAMILAMICVIDLDEGFKYAGKEICFDTNACVLNSYGHGIR